MDGLLGDEALEASSVVANCAMNRERQLVGVNSYARELGFNPLDWLRARVEQLLAVGGSGRVSWLDLCCGTGRPLVQAAEQLHLADLGDRADLVGVDLVDYFDPPPHPPTVRLVAVSVTELAPPHTFDLITCVHGLHYVGDKLGVLARAAGWLTDGGLLVADLDLGAVRLPDGPPVGRPLASALRVGGLTYDPRRRRVTCTGRRRIALPCVYLGADERAGPNHTGQPVHSYYTRSP